jgi:hypothetical protein
MVRPRSRNRPPARLGVRISDKTRKLISNCKQTNEPIDDVIQRALIVYLEQKKSGAELSEIVRLQDLSIDQYIKEQTEFKNVIAEYENVIEILSSSLKLVDKSNQLHEKIAPMVIGALTN